MFLCDCPPPTALTLIPNQACTVRFDQTARLIFQRLRTGTTINKLENATLKATYTALTDATDSTKIVFSPLIANPANTPGEEREFGGGNETPNGIPYSFGSGPSEFTYELHNVDQSVVKAMQKLWCEKNLGVYLVNRFGHIAGAKTATANELTPFPLHSFFLSDLQLGNYEEPDRNMGKFMLKEYWSENFGVIKPTDTDLLLDF